LALPDWCKQEGDEDRWYNYLGRNPYGPTDKQVIVMKIAGTDGTSIGAVYDYATHATSLGRVTCRSV